MREDARWASSQLRSLVEVSIGRHFQPPANRGPVLSRVAGEARDQPLGPLPDVKVATSASIKEKSCSHYGATAAPRSATPKGRRPTK